MTWPRRSTIIRDVSAAAIDEADDDDDDVDVDVEVDVEVDGASIFRFLALGGSH